MSRKKKKRHRAIVIGKPAVRIADGWILFQCSECGAEFYYRPNTDPFCVNNCGPYAHEEEEAS
jgi:hypothetical protein